MAAKKHGSDGGKSGRARPTLKSSHERVLEGGAKKPRARRPERPTRAQRPPLPRPVTVRARPAKKARPSAGESPREPAAGWSVATETARERATAIAVAALDKKAVALEILDVAGKVDYADFLVIMTGRSDRHAQALAQGIEEALRTKGMKPIAVEGLPHGSWVLMDFGDVVVHVFQDEARQLYDIEGLWLDAHRLPVPASAPSE